MVEVLKNVVLDAEQVVEGIVKVAADAGAADAGGLGFQIEHLAEHARFPE